jgi:hypothetical protein
MNNVTQDVWYSQANEFDTFEYEGIEYPIKWYGGILFATEELSDAIIDEETGYGKDGKAMNMDDRIAFYFSSADFEGKTGKELYEYSETL